MGLGSLRRHDIQLICRIRGERNDSSSYKQISQINAAKISPKPHSLAMQKLLKQGLRYYNQGF